MDRSQDTLSPVMEELHVLEGNLLSVVAEVRNMREVLGSIKFPKEEEERCRQSLSRSQLLGDSAFSAVPPPEAAALSRLRQLVQYLQKSLKAELNQLMSLNFRIDLEPLFAPECGIGNVIRSFQAVGAGTLCDALTVFSAAPRANRKKEREDLALLLWVGADLDGLVVGQTALMRAIFSGNFTAVQMLVEAGAGLEVKLQGEGYHAGKTALHIACKEKKAGIGKYLISRGADVNAETAKSVRPLYYAAQEGQVSLVKNLLKKGAAVDAKDADGETALHGAAKTVHTDIARALLNHGANIDEPNNSHQTPLNLTAIPVSGSLTDHRGMAAFLLSRGADPNSRVLDGSSVLHHAAYWGSLGVAELLLDHGANLGGVDNEAWTALHWAASYSAMREGGNGERSSIDGTGEGRDLMPVVRLLVGRGIDVNAVDNSGNTAAVVARHFRNSSVHKFLTGDSLEEEEGEEEEGDGAEEEEEGVEEEEGDGVEEEEEGEGDGVEEEEEGVEEEGGDGVEEEEEAEEGEGDEGDAEEEEEEEEVDGEEGENEVDGEEEEEGEEDTGEEEAEEEDGGDEWHEEEGGKEEDES
uniref:Uncharacterized protein n=1 Tax=Chromera velia CCMP2878 TaxID=1169474 RepID=A0A0G4GTM4_9ALVE|eukprot:Cvel_23335.t1-p1 / transcript=Cvel_23335.t1 / gene=Cvel_23335 / organism=Chromera_velia_CCMP2878 / gene_product=Ankyrin-3, putative / transcript_product=Ankyrin-3, putative / location=Cvel_scaffold2391:21400-23142(-) / protein_length=581 / sequence_SO=supercontig / SO=protein_coding / is_pseudo=false